jgi:hypothetical protein
MNMPKVNSLLTMLLVFWELVAKSSGLEGVFFICLKFSLAV